MDFQKLMSEIEYYESVGKYKLADDLSSKLLRVAREFKIEDMGSGSEAYRNKAEMQQLEYYISTIPECALCSQVGVKGEFNIVQDLTDQIADLVSKGATLPQATQQALSNQSRYRDVFKDNKLPPACITCMERMRGVTASSINPRVPSGNTPPPAVPRVSPSSGVPPIK